MLTLPSIATGVVPVADGLRVAEICCARVKYSGSALPKCSCDEAQESSPGVLAENSPPVGGSYCTDRRVGAAAVR